MCFCLSMYSLVSTTVTLHCHSLSNQGCQPLALAVSFNAPPLVQLVSGEYRFNPFYALLLLEPVERIIRKGDGALLANMCPAPVHTQAMNSIPFWLFASGTFYDSWGQLWIEPRMAAPAQDNHGALSGPSLPTGTTMPLLPLGHGPQEAELSRPSKRTRVTTEGAEPQETGQRDEPAVSNEDNGVTSSKAQVADAHSTTTIEEADTTEKPVESEVVGTERPVEGEVVDAEKPVERVVTGVGKAVESGVVGAETAVSGEVTGKETTVDSEGASKKDDVRGAPVQPSDDHKDNDKDSPVPSLTPLPAAEDVATPELDAGTDVASPADAETVAVVRVANDTNNIDAGSATDNDELLGFLLDDWDDNPSQIDTNPVERVGLLESMSSTRLKRTRSTYEHPDVPTIPMNHNRSPSKNTGRSQSTRHLGDDRQNMDFGSQELDSSSNDAFFNAWINWPECSAGPSEPSSGDPSPLSDDVPVNTGPRMLANDL